MLWKSGQGSKSIIQRFELIKFATRYPQKELNSLLLPADLYQDFYFILFSYHRFSLLKKKKPTVQKWEEKSKKKNHENPTVCRGNMYSDTRKSLSMHICGQQIFGPIQKIHKQIWSTTNGCGQKPFDTWTRCFKGILDWTKCPVRI